MKPVDYVDPRIGNVAPYLKPTYPTFHQPNQMPRMFPVKGSYLEDQVQAFPLQVTGHRRSGLFQMRVVRGPVDAEDWRRPMPIDHDLETVRPWHYETVLISGSGQMVAKAEGAHAFSLVETWTHKSTSPGFDPVVVSVWCYGEITDGQGVPARGVQMRSDEGRLTISFSAGVPDSVQLKYAVSYVSADQARRNYEAEVEKENFAGLSSSARSAWEHVLGGIEVEGGTVAQRRTFYTALYKTHERMVDINEAGRYFSAYDQQVHESERPFYVDDWVWDSFRAHHPLRTILHPAQQEDMLQSYVEMYRQSGWMPTFPLIDGNHPAMTCYHSSSLFLDAHRKGLSNSDLEEAYDGVRKNLTEGTWIPWRQGTPKTPLDQDVRRLGFFPGLHSGEPEPEPLVDEFELFMPKDNKGKWIHLDPELGGGQGFRAYYAENNGWTYAWSVLHDIPGLEALLGGPEAAVERLDQFFREPLGTDRYLFPSSAPDSTGMVGQFSMGNEPSFHIPYLHNYFGAPWKTQQRTRFLLDVCFKDNIFGILGDEDGGSMSAWVVFTSVGFYPVTPGMPVYAITTPLCLRRAVSPPGPARRRRAQPGSAGLPGSATAVHMRVPTLWNAGACSCFQLAEFARPNARQQAAA